MKRLLLIGLLLLATVAAEYKLPGATTSLGVTFFQQEAHRLLPEDRNERRNRYNSNRQGPYQSAHRRKEGSYYMNNGSQRQKQKIYYDSPYSRLSDVWLCLAMALGWTVWMLSSFVRSDLMRYSKGSVLVRGHVLQVSVVDSFGGSTLPTYKAVIDYMVDSKQTQERIQVRKHFETQHMLEEGFANVELLVLPDEPTYSVLREDYNQQIEDQKEDEQESFIPPSYCKRISMAFAGILTVLSLAGCVEVVARLDPLERWKGWLSLCTGVTFLLPAGLSIHRSLVAVHRVMEWQSRAGAVILRGATSKLGRSCWDDTNVLDPRSACDDQEQDFILQTPRNAANDTTKEQTPGSVLMMKPTVSSDGGENQILNRYEGSTTLGTSCGNHQIQRQSNCDDYYFVELDPSRGRCLLPPPRQPRRGGKKKDCNTDETRLDSSMSSMSGEPYMSRENSATSSLSSSPSHQVQRSPNRGFLS